MQAHCIDTLPGPGQVRSGLSGCWCAHVYVPAAGSSHLQLGMSAEPLHGQGFFGTYPGVLTH
jgi:hypothetical protein